MNKTKANETCQHQWKITHEAWCSFDFTEAICELCGKEIAEGGLMDSHCLEDPTIPRE